MQRLDRRQRRGERLCAGDIDRAGLEQRDHALELVEIPATSANRPARSPPRARRHAGPPARTARDRRCCRTGSPADARRSGLAPESRRRPSAPAAARRCRSPCVHGASALARSPRKIRSGVCRAQCSSQSPTQRALSRSGVVDFRMMLPSARRSATIAGVANSVSDWSRLGRRLASSVSSAALCCGQAACSTRDRRGPAMCHRAPEAVAMPEIAPA